jgi:nucleoside diphosphate kinase
MSSARPKTSEHSISLRYESHGVPLEPFFTCDEKKRLLYSADTYFLEAAEQLGQHTADVAGFCRAHSLLLFKPDAVLGRRIGPALEWLAGKGYRVVAAERVRLNRHVLRAIWYFQWNLATAERRSIADFLLTYTDSLVLVVRASGQDTVPCAVRLAEQKGPTDPAARGPGHLRHLMGNFTFLLNLVHSPDDPADVVRELGVYFDTADRAAVVSQALAGQDQAARAANLIDELYASVSERDIALTATVDRVLAAVRSRRDGASLARVEELLSRGEPADIRDAVDLAQGGDLGLDPVDIAIMGAYVLPMKLTGIKPVLGAIGPDDWREPIGG